MISGSNSSFPARQLGQASRRGDQKSLIVRPYSMAPSLQGLRFSQDCEKLAGGVAQTLSLRHTRRWSLLARIQNPVCREDSQIDAVCLLTDLVDPS